MQSRGGDWVCNCLFKCVRRGAVSVALLLTAVTRFVITRMEGSAEQLGRNGHHVVGASDTQGGMITGDFAGSTSLSDTIARLGPGQSGVFKFRRRIK